MASLIQRRNGSVYESIPGYTQPNPVPVPNMLATSIVGQNQPIFYDENYRVTSPLSNYAQFEREYAFDSVAWGQLGTGYGAAARRAMSPQGFYDMYPSLNSSMRSQVSGEFGTAQIRATIDWDMPNKAAEPGTTAYWRKMGEDMKFTQYSPEEIQQAQDYEDTYGQSDRIRNEFYKFAYHGNNLEFRPAPGGGSYEIRQPKALPSVAPDFLGWNKPNENLTPGWDGVSDRSRTMLGLNNITRNFNVNSRLAPTSISQGRGIFSGPVYSLSGNFNTSAMRQLMNQVSSRRW